jgi:peroxiredoxin
MEPSALRAGDAAPDVELDDSRGSRIRLSDLWRTQPLLLVFLRHYG